MKLRIYLDTSVISAYVDERGPERQKETKNFYERLKEFDVSISEAVIKEIRGTREEHKRKRMEELVHTLTIHQISEEMLRLRDIYLREKVFTPATIDDALHVACAVLSQSEVLVSWNFRHMVNRHKRALINEVNIRYGYTTIEIVSPPEV